MTNEHRTARRFREPSPLFRWCRARGYFNPPGRALVFGAGLLVEAQALADMGWAVDALETADSVSRRPTLYDSFAARRGCRVLTDLSQAGTRYRMIVVTHVLEFVEDRHLRGRLLNELALRLSPRGKLLLSLRGWADVYAAKRRTPRGDGIVTGLGTWCRGYSVLEAIEFLEAAGLEVEGGPTSLTARNPEQARFVCRRRK